MSAVDIQPVSKPARSGGFTNRARDPMGMLGLLLALLLILTALLAPWIAPYGPNAMDIPSKLQGPNAAHWLGTDQLSRNVLSRAIYGGQITLSVALISTALARLCADTGVRHGARLSGDYSGVGHRPDLWRRHGGTGGTAGRNFYALLRADHAGFGHGAGQIRICRSTVHDGRVRIVACHILPNVIGPVLIVASMDIPTFIAAEAGLSFLGVGAKPPASSWGLMLRCGFDFVGHTPWLVVAAYTRDGAWADFNEHRKGRQRVDMMADVVVMDRDLELQRAGQLSLAQAALTLCGGQITFEA